MKLRKKAKLRYQIANNVFEKNQAEGMASVRPKLLNIYAITAADLA
ncbi:MAG: hypothetical protein H0W50_10625 [Parachlamydiaceae bacterium]|nr:hypothetical protein [Parachlamydiaceae bacterium]